MTTVSAPGIANVLRRSELQRLWWRHPEIPALVAAAAAWVALAVRHWNGHSAAPGLEPWRFDVIGWMIMVVAMMLPALIPMIRVLAFDSMWRRRHRAPALFVITYVVLWTAVASAAALVVWMVTRGTGASFDPGGLMVATIVLAAAAWQFTPGKVRSLRRCHQRTPLAPRGWRADRSVITYAIVHARACMGSCGFAMAAMFVAAHDFHLMVPLTAVLVVERLQPRPKPQLGGVALGALAGFLFLFELAP